MHAQIYLGMLQAKEIQYFQLHNQPSKKQLWLVSYFTRSSCERQLNISIIEHRLTRLTRGDGKWDKNVLHVPAHPVGNT